MAAPGLPPHVEENLQVREREREGGGGGERETHPLARASERESECGHTHTTLMYAHTNTRACKYMYLRKDLMQATNQHEYACGRAVDAGGAVVPHARLERLRPRIAPGYHRLRPTGGTWRAAGWTAAGSDRMSNRKGRRGG